MLTKKYLITYDLKTPNWNYTGFYDALKNQGEWWHYLASTWIIKKTTLTPQQIYNNIAPHISRKDLILIVEIVPQNKYGILPRDAWDWLDT
jgi:hypothetical protein